MTERIRLAVVPAGETTCYLSRCRPSCRELYAIAVEPPLSGWVNPTQGAVENVCIPILVSGLKGVLQTRDDVWHIVAANDWSECEEAEPTCAGLAVAEATWVLGVASQPPHDMRLLDP